MSNNKPDDKDLKEKRLPLLRPPKPWQPRLEVAKIQRVLKEMGYDIKTIDGYPGPETRQALLRFQQDHGLHPDGEIGPETIAKIQEIQGQNP